MSIPPFPEDKPTSGTDLLALYQFLNTMHQNLMAQSRSTNNNMANLLSVIQTLQQDVHELIRVQDATRERRYEEEITVIENQLAILQKQLDEKKSAKVETLHTSEKIKKVMEEQAKKKAIDWLAVRQVMVNAAAGALAVGIVWGIVTLLPEIALWLRSFLGR